MVHEIKNPAELEIFLKEHKITNLLLGNGFCLAHPKFKDAFSWDHVEIQEEFLKQLSECKSKSLCPESYISEIRLNLSEKILDSFVRKFGSIVSENSSENAAGIFYKYCNLGHSCENFLTHFQKIFTVNYDPLMYFEIIKILRETKKTPSKFYRQYIDGFNGPNFIKPSKIIEKLDNFTGGKIYFLHGSWFIRGCSKTHYELKKISFDWLSSFLKAALYENSKKEKPYVILEDRWWVKQALINNSEYFTYCLKKLNNLRGNLLIFGMSFRNDIHILNNLENSHMDKIFVSVYNDYLEVKNRIKNFPKLNEKIEYISVHPNVMWEENKISVKAVI